MIIAGQLISLIVLLAFSAVLREVLFAAAKRLEARWDARKAAKEASRWTVTTFPSAPWYRG